MQTAGRRVRSPPLLALPPRGLLPPTHQTCLPYLAAKNFTKKPFNLPTDLQTWQVHSSLWHQDINYFTFRKWITPHPRVVILTHRQTQISTSLLAISCVMTPYILCILAAWVNVFLFLRFALCLAVSSLFKRHGLQPLVRMLKYTVVAN